MPYVIASKKLGRAGGPYWISPKVYETPGAAKAALTRYLKSGRLDEHVARPWGQKAPKGDWAIYDMLTYQTKIVRKIRVKSLMNPNGPDIEITTDTPLCCDPSSETYWSM